MMFLILFEISYRFPIIFDYFQNVKSQIKIHNVLVQHQSPKNVLGTLIICLCMKCVYYCVSSRCFKMKPTKLIIKKHKIYEWIQNKTNATLILSSSVNNWCVVNKWFVKNCKQNIYVWHWTDLICRALSPLPTAA